MTGNTMELLREAKSLDDLYPSLNANRMTAGWHKVRPSLWKEPRTEFRPRHWSYEAGRLALDQASRWIGTELAERRNLLLFNPVGDNDYATARTLVAAYQMVMPGEHARAHRHTPNALRFVVDAEPGLFTVVNGVKLPMKPGDVLLTPGGCWHSHYNEGVKNAYWIDVLDVPLVHLLEPMFFDPYPDVFQKVTSEPAQSEFWFGRDETERGLSAAEEQRPGVRVLPLDVQKHFATLGLQFLRIDKGATTGVTRSTASRIFSVARGSGVAQMGDVRAAWRRGDVFVVPSWTNFEITADDEAVLFEVNDEPVLHALRLFREER
jgi:gentisate 1,2-dioxygenase